MRNNRFHGDIVDNSQIDEQKVLLINGKACII
jgi:hypothetical protein